MEYTDAEKVKKIKRIIITRIQNINDLSVLKTMINGGLTEAKIKNFLDTDLQADSEQDGLDSQGSLDSQAKKLALQEEIKTF